MSLPVLRSLAKLNLYLLVGGVALLMILPLLLDDRHCLYAGIGHHRLPPPSGSRPG